MSSFWSCTWTEKSEWWPLSVDPSPLVHCCFVCEAQVREPSLGILNYFPLWYFHVSSAKPACKSPEPALKFREAQFNFLRHVMRAILSARPKWAHRCVSLKEPPLKPVQILKHTTKDSTEQTAMRTKWFKHIGIEIVQVHLLEVGKTGTYTPKLAL